MESKNVTSLSLPVQGMTCGGCAENVTHAIQKLPGVSRVDVDLTARLASIDYDPSQVDLLEFQQAVSDAGYTVPTQEIRLTVQGMSCMSCVAHVEGALTDLPAVLKASVNLSKGTVQVIFVQGLVTPTEMVQAVQSTGYQAAVLDAFPQASATDNELPQGDPGHRFNANRIGQVKRLFKRG